MASQDIRRRAGPGGSEGSVLRLVRDAEEWTGTHSRREERGGGRAGFDWLMDTAEEPAHDAPRGESARMAAHFQLRLAEASARRAEVALQREEAELRAARANSRLSEQAQRQEIRQRGRTGTVAYIRSVVLLAALMWALAILGLSSAGSPLAARITPQGLIHSAASLLRDAEAARGASLTQPSGLRQ
jgi:hypothetical protein